MGQVRYMAPKLSGQNCEFFCVLIPKRDLNTKKTTPNIAVCPESLRATLEFRYIELGLLALLFCTLWVCKLCSIRQIIKKYKTCTVFLSSFRNTNGSLGEREMLWEQEPQASVYTAFSSSPKLSRVFL